MEGVPVLLQQVAYHRASTDASIEVYTESVSRNPNDAIARTSLGMALLRQDRVTEALEHLQHAVEVCRRALHVFFVDVGV